METLQITKENALKAYNAGCPDVKQVLSTLFGDKTFAPQKITDRINGWDDILKISGANAKNYELRPGESADELAQRKIKLIASVYNEGTVLDPSNTSQYKYYPWFYIVKDANKPSGFGLSSDGYVSWHSHSGVGVRLCFKSELLAIDAGKKFISIYEDLLIR
jgi:hypothetical protein